MKGTRMSKGGTSIIYIEQRQQAGKNNGWKPSFEWRRERSDSRRTFGWLIGTSALDCTESGSGFQSLTISRATQRFIGILFSCLCVLNN